MVVNCDIGERGVNHPTDLKLMTLISTANIACGGHAGDRESVDAFCALADKNNVTVSAHLSYPDKENFGRISMKIDPERLADSLSEQYELMPPAVKRIKFHGALYNDAVAEGRLASFLTEWMKRNAVNEVIAPNDSALAAAARNAGIKVEAEGFAERRYIWDPRTRQLALMPRRYPEASIKNLKEAVEQSVRMVRSGEVTAFVETGGEWIERLCPIVVETVCIHSDSVIAVDLAELLRKC